MLDLHKYDGASQQKHDGLGIEARVLSDMSFIDYAMPDPKPNAGDGKLEKPIRKAFEGLLPEHTCGAKRNNDGVGYLWIDTLKAQAESRVSDKDRPKLLRVPHQSTQHQRGLLHRDMFESLLYPQHPPSPGANRWRVHKSLEGHSTSNVVDPSGRAVTDVHADGYNPPPAR